MRGNVMPVAAAVSSALVCWAPAALADAAGSACPNAAVRTAQRSERLPDCRAYELVSPIDKSGGDVTVTATETQAARADRPARLHVQPDLVRAGCRRRDVGCR